MSVERAIYTRDLRRLGYGFPLYDPKSTGYYDRVRVGDVGYLKNGQFHSIFNAFHSRDDVVNQRRKIPDIFEPVPLEHRETSFSTPLPAGTTFALVDGKAIAGNIDLNIQSGNPASVSITATKSVSRSAVLHIKQAAEFEYATHDKFLKKYALDNYEDWVYSLHICGPIDARRSDIMFVTGCYMTGEWAIAASKNQTSSAQFSASAGVPSIASVSAGLSQDHKFQLHMPVRYGPDPDKYHQEAKSEKDQCIFVKAYYVKRGIFLSARFLEVDDCYLTSEDPMSAKGARGIEVHEGILDTILRVSETVDVAIVDDADIYSFMDATADEFEGLTSLSDLQERGLDVLVEEDLSSGSRVGTIKRLLEEDVPSDKLSAGEVTVVAPERLGEDSPTDKLSVGEATVVSLKRLGESAPTDKLSVGDAIRRAAGRLTNRAVRLLTRGSANIRSRSVKHPPEA